MSLALADRLNREIWAEMGRQKITQDVLASKIGMSSTSLRRRFRLSPPFNITELERAAVALGKQSDYFLIFLAQPPEHVTEPEPVGAVA